MGQMEWNIVLLASYLVDFRCIGQNLHPDFVDPFYQKWAICANGYLSTFVTCGIVNDPESLGVKWHFIMQIT